MPVCHCIIHCLFNRWVLQLPDGVRISHAYLVRVCVQCGRAHHTAVGDAHGAAFMVAVA